MTMPGSTTQASLHIASTTKRLLATCAVTLGGMFLLYYSYYLLHSNAWQDMFGHIMGRDFSLTWGVALLLAQGNITASYDPSVLNATIEHFFNLPVYFIWGYPPHYFLLLWPLSYVPYGIALYGWLLGSAAFLSYMLWRFCKWKKYWLFMLIGSPAWLYNFFAGQNGFLTAGLLVGALIVMQKRQRLASLCIAALTIKPQLGFAVAIALLGKRAWRVIALSSLFTLMPITLSIACWGTESWAAFYQSVLLLKQALWIDRINGEFRIISPTLSNSLYLLNIASPIISAAQLLLSATILGYYYYLIRRYVISAESLFIFTILATFLASPYLFNYDMVCLAIAALFWLRSGLAKGMTRQESYCILLLWTAPVLTIIFNKMGMPIMPVLLAYIFWVFSRKIKSA